ncbi:trypsin-like serine protease [Candidatus Poriferisodalis sp.]|uniref:trypsin-like serine protease n=1 Tax=Candidatus Poriferisodalis sp. TaxID=3101277 RepID=UPI003B5213DF
MRVHGASLKACSGDSGGPWYRGSIAYGIHRGSNSGNDCNKTGVYASFSSVGEVEQFLGVDILHRMTVRFLG